MSYLTCSLPLMVGPDLPHVELNNNYTGVGGSLESKLISTKGEYDLRETPSLPPPLHSVCRCMAPTPFAARNAHAEAGSALLTGDITCRNSPGSGTRNTLLGKTKVNSNSKCPMQLSARQLHSPIRFPPPICTGKDGEEMPDAAGHAEQIRCVCLKH